MTTNVWSIFLFANINAFNWACVILIVYKTVYDCARTDTHKHTLLSVQKKMYMNVNAIYITDS